MEIIGFTGYSGSGKTTLIEQVIPILTRRGIKVSVIKHAHRSFDIDQPGKDSYRFREAGATEVMLVSPKRWALIHEFVEEEEIKLNEQASHLAPCDLLIVEGFKLSDIPKIEVHRPALGKPLIGKGGKNIIAIATDCCIDSDTGDCPMHLDLNDPEFVADFISSYIRLGARKRVDLCELSHHILG